MIKMKDNNILKKHINNNLNKDGVINFGWRRQKV
jgi:hypothetical protein